MPDNIESRRGEGYRGHQPDVEAFRSDAGARWFWIYLIDGTISSTSKFNGFASSDAALHQGMLPARLRADGLS